MTLEGVIALAAKYTVARMLERDDFMNRFEKERPISIHEFLYPLIQGYDSVQVKADVEVGGTDQKFNMLVGRELQREFREAPQVIMTLPLLEGTDGVQKMSKSLGNYIGITDPPSEIYGKIMSISDDLMMRYFELLTDVSLEEVRNMHPKEAKKKLARILVSRFYGEKEALAAEEEFEAIFKEGKLPQEIELITLPQKEISLVDLLFVSRLAPSKSEARRLIQQKAVSVDEKLMVDEKQVIDLKDEHILKVGKRRFLRVKGK
jgi:tyrosyl-tRNA synthetase